jgi:hypothetical protein
MSEKDRNEIAGMLTKREIEDLGAPWLSMAEAPMQDNYRIAPSTSYVSPSPSPAYGGDSGSPLTLEGFGEGGGDKLKRLSPYGGMRLRYGRSF